MLSDDDLRHAVIDAMPLHGLLEMRVGDGEARLDVTLPDLPQTRNHLGGQAGGGLFAVAEAASAAAVFDTLESVLDEVFAVPAGGSITFRRPGRGGVTARATLDVTPETVRTAVRAGDSLKSPVAVVLRDAEGETVAEADVLWHLGPQRPGSPRALPRRGEAT